MPLYNKHTTAAEAKLFAVHTIIYKNNETVLVSHAEAYNSKPEIEFSRCTT